MYCDIVGAHTDSNRIDYFQRVDYLKEQVTGAWYYRSVDETENGRVGNVHLNRACYVAVLDMASRRC